MPYRQALPPDVVRVPACPGEECGPTQPGVVLSEAEPALPQAGPSARAGSSGRVTESELPGSDSVPRDDDDGATR